MSEFRFPEPYQHEHPPVINVYEDYDKQQTRAQRLADAVARVIGSWRFIIFQSSVLIVWIILNVTAWIQAWDPYPFILMNLVLSTQAAFTAPIIMMSQNRQAARDRLMVENDYHVNLKAEEEIKILMAHLHAQDTALRHIMAALDDIRAQRAAPSGTTPDTPTPMPETNAV